MFGLIREKYVDYLITCAQTRNTRRIKELEEENAALRSTLDKYMIEQHNKVQQHKPACSSHLFVGSPLCPGRTLNIEQEKGGSGA